MKLRVLLAAFLVAFHFAVAAPFSTNGNRLTYLDSDDPFYVGRDFPKLITPQWVGEEGVDAVVILSIDDMRETPKYEAMLRPILERLKKIDGRAPVSIMANTIAPANAQIQSWLKEGVSIEAHTIQHPCPLCQRGDFTAASTNYHACVDLMSSIPGNKPVAFRMPCCDSMNSPSPRFYAEIFNRLSPQENFLGVDSSVMVILTTNDTTLPHALVLDADGRERFRKYLPTQTNATTRVSMGSFTTTIEDYPYPYVIGKTCWEFPCIVPSDWEANNLHAPNNPKTVEDWKRALDAIVLKQGVMTFIFHPHGWIKPEQMVEFIHYAAAKYGRRVKFLNFREAQERLQQHLLSGQTLRRSSDGGDNGVRLLDVNNDGFLDVTLGFQDRRVTRVWEPARRAWRDMEFPLALIDSNPDGSSFDTGVKFGVLRADGNATAIGPGALPQSAWHFDGRQWMEDKSWEAGIDLARPRMGRDRGVRLRDIDRDGRCELLVGNESQNVLFKWSASEKRWIRLPYSLPERTGIVDARGQDAGLRFADVDGDGYDDILFSNHERYSLHLFRNDARNLRLKPGWTDEIISGTRVNVLTDSIPPIVRDGTNRNNGVWFKNGTMWIQNEDTAHLPDKVDRRTFKQLLSGSQPRARSPEESLRAMRVRPGFKIELIASEPLIQSPVAFEWTADGRLWVVEMGDYPSGTDGKGKGGGRVRVLEDPDGDGRYDQGTTFLDALNFPTGIYPWRNGVIVSAAPDIFYAEDTNGDGKADVREVLFTGFTPGNQQHRVNGFDYGLDGWLCGANGDSGGNVRGVGQASRLSGPGGTPSLPLNLRGQDFRIHPDTRLIEPIAGQTQFGRHRDDFGNWFGNNNPSWLWHYFFPEHYLARNPLLPLKTTKRMLANYAESARCFPISRTLSRFNDAHAANHVTSGNSPTPYRDDLFGKDFETSVFISEPVHNLVHREALKPDGVTFTSQRASDETNSEFLASSDNWFRPTMLKTGPDGALYIADMYRLVIEHPEWIPKEMQARLDLRAGADKGRIYRGYLEGVTLRKIPRLDQMDRYALGEALQSGNGWQRDTAQRLLTEQKIPLWLALFTTAMKNPNPKVRVQLLATMAALGGIDTGVLAAAFEDEDARVREQAVLVAERVLQGASTTQLRPTHSGETLSSIARAYKTSVSVLLAMNPVEPDHLKVGQVLQIPISPEIVHAGLLKLASDPEARVRYQVAFTLGEWSDSRAADALVKLARDTDENIRNAALTSAPRHAKAMLAQVETLPPEDVARRIIPMLKKLKANPPALAPKTTFVERTNTMSSAQRAEREKILARYTDVARLKGGAQNGTLLYQQNCAQCHRLRGEGLEVGPDLGMMSAKPIEQLVQAILDPNAAMETRYQNFTATTKDGHDISGIIIAETPTTLTLRAPNKADETILRAELKELTASGLSLMPEGLEAAFTPQQLADLIAYIRR
ncbi:MAG TPA: PVC-type heme-binding CxxCH protein [Candidatus Limnocylindria bacterium]|nr:PVC-type heme-binding CxxCH protein [Candidatus Limnocylindria bacterium]